MDSIHYGWACMDAQVWDFKRLAPKGWKVMAAKDMEGKVTITEVDYTVATAFKSFSTMELRKMNVWS